MAIGKILSNILKEKNTAVTDLARDIGVAPTTIYSIIDRDNMKIDIAILIKICKSLDVDINTFYEDYLNDCKSTISVTKAKFSFSEQEHIKKYRTLDEYGKKAVDELLETEYERCTAIQEEEEPKEIQMIEIKSSVYNKASAGTGFMLDNEEWETIEIPDTYESRQADFALTISGNSMEPIYHNGDIVLVKSQPNVEIGEIGIFIINDEGYIKKYGGDRLISLNNDYKDILFSEGDYIKCSGKVIGRV